MTTQQQAYALFLSDELLKGMWAPNVLQNESALRARAAQELRRQHAEIETLRAGYDAARLEIESLRERVQMLGQLARDVNSRRVTELEAQLAAVGAGGVEPLRKRECLHQITEPVQPLVCDYCGAFTPDPWHSSGMMNGKMSKHIHSCDACAAQGAAQVQAMLAAAPRNATLYDPDDVAFPVQRCADGTDAPTELTSIAKQASTAATAATSVPIKAGEYPELPEWSKRDDLGGLVPGEVRQALRTYADATCAARVVYSRSMDLVRTFWQQHTESDALSMTMAELHDDVELVIRAARKPLADGVLHALYADVMTGHYADGLHYWRGTPAHRLARAIEQAHGITAAQKGGQHAD